MEPTHETHPTTDRAWSDADVRHYLGIEQNQLKVLLDSPGFPEPRRLEGIRSARRWDPEAFPAWVAAPELKRLDEASRTGKRGTAARV